MTARPWRTGRRRAERRVQIEEAAVAVGEREAERHDVEQAIEAGAASAAAQLVEQQEQDRCLGVADRDLEDSKSAAVLALAQEMEAAVLGDPNQLLERRAGAVAGPTQRADQERADWRRSADPHHRRGSP